VGRVWVGMKVGKKDEWVLVIEEVEEKDYLFA